MVPLTEKRLEQQYDDAVARLLAAFNQMLESDAVKNLCAAYDDLDAFYQDLSNEYEDQGTNDRFCHNIACSVHFPLIGRFVGNVDEFCAREWATDNETLMYAQAVAAALTADSVDLKETFDDLLINE